MPSRSTTPTTPEQRANMRQRANQEGTAIGGYHVLRLLDDLNERDRLLELAAEDLEDWHQGHQYDDTIALIKDIRALLRPSPEQGAPDE